MGLSNHTIAKPYNNEGTEQYEDGKNKAKHCKDRQGKRAQKHENKRLKHMTKRLDLTEQQVADIKAIFEEARDNREQRAEGKMTGKRDGLMALDPSAADYQEKVDAIALKRANLAQQHVLARAEVMAKVHAVLTPEQQLQERELKAKRLERRNR